MESIVKVIIELEIGANNQVCKKGGLKRCDLVRSFFKKHGTFNSFLDEVCLFIFQDAGIESVVNFTLDVKFGAKMQVANEIMLKKCDSVFCCILF